jgi:hypothetical protein
VIIGAHEEGPLIRSRKGFWLAIPTAQQESPPVGVGSAPVSGSAGVGYASVSSIVAAGQACW